LHLPLELAWSLRAHHSDRGIGRRHLHPAILFSGARRFATQPDADHAPGPFSAPARLAPANAHVVEAVSILFSGTAMRTSIDWLEAWFDPGGASV
jgi:hypothetical protein